MKKFDPTILTVALLVFFWLIAENKSTANSVEDLYKKGFDLSIEGKPQDAIRVYLQALEIKPSSAKVHHALAVLYYESNRGIQAIDHFRKAALHYRERDDEQAKLNATIVKNNLEKAYKELGLTPEDFGLGSSSSAEDEWSASGVGFFIGGQGNLLTSYHVVKDAKNIRARFADGQTALVSLARKFIVYDIAILQLNQPSVAPSRILSFENNSHPQVGDTVYAIDFSKLHAPGSPLYKGTILRQNALENSTKIFQLDLNLKNDQSGGPLFNEDGAVIGMVFPKQFAEKHFSYLHEAPEGVSFAIKSSYLKQILSGLFNLPEQTKKRSKEAKEKFSRALKNISQEFRGNFVFLETSN
ncbi:MAG: trypsin-like peptidase domain-containing protein [Nitrospinae bacterium]|nr:trypsin-like peptidase domain-containing protein [Nitrospinota bacterium]